MTEDRVEVSRDGLSRLQSAAEAFARAEVARIAGVVIDDLRSQSANDTFGEVAARHLWDEYCWSLQEGPFDDDMGWDGLRLGSLSGAFEDVVRASIQCVCLLVRLCVRVQLTVDPIMSAMPAAAIVSVTSFLVSHWSGVRISIWRSRRVENKSSRPRSTLGCVVRVARPPTTSPASGGLMLTTPFS